MVAYIVARNQQARSLSHGVLLEDKVVEGVKGIFRIKTNIRCLKTLSSECCGNDATGGQTEEGVRIGG